MWIAAGYSRTALFDESSFSLSFAGYGSAAPQLSKCQSNEITNLSMQVTSMPINSFEQLAFVAYSVR
jgi:hypothetical protein